MNRNATIVASVLALAGGVAAVIVADRQGWLNASGDATTPTTSASGAAATTKIEPFAIRPRRDEVTANVVAASNVRELASLPRAQRDASSTCENADKAVVFDDASVAAAAGIRWNAAAAAPVTHIIQCNAEIAFDGERLAHVSSRAPGVVQQALRQSGDRVKAGDALAVIDSSDLGGAKASLLQSTALVRLWSDNLSRLQSLSGSGAVTQQELMEAETSLTEAKIELSRATQRLRNLGLPTAEVDRVLADNDTSASLAVTAPFDGVIIERHAVLGEVIETQTPLFVVADTSRMWVTLDVRETDMQHVALGQRVVVMLPAMPGEPFAGAIEWISAQVDDTTRTLKARASLDNTSGSGGRLRANMFGKAQIFASDSQSHVVVPRDAVQWDGCCNLVFVRQTDSIFQPFKVRLGADLGDHYVVLEGLREGDEVVTGGAFLLRTQLLKSSIGAGCCEADAVTKR